MDFLNQLKIEDNNSGACWGSDNWSQNTSHSIQSINPTNNQPIAEVYTATATDYQSIMSSAELAFIEWRKKPAPLRGEIVRQIGDALRENKDALGSLVSL